VADRTALSTRFRMELVENAVETTRSLRVPGTPTGAVMLVVCSINVRVLVGVETLLVVSGDFGSG